MKATLRERIEEAKKEFESYPEWVKKNSIFQGGEASEFRSPSRAERSEAFSGKDVEGAKVVE